MMKVSIIIPVYNEVKTIKQVIERVDTFVLENVDKEMFVNFPSGICTKTPDGDGCFPVYVKRDVDGRILEVKIVFR